MNEGFDSKESVQSPEQKLHAAVRHFESVCADAGYDAVVQALPDSEHELAIFLYSDDGAIAEQRTQYEILMNSYRLYNPDADKYSLTLADWQGIPYIKVEIRYE